MRASFETAALTHLDAAYNLARWLLRDPHAAQDAVQEAYVRALKYAASFHGDDMRPWLLSIVRNTCYSWLKLQSQHGDHVEFDEERDGGDTDQAGFDNPEHALLRKQQGIQVNAAIQALPAAFREVLILRELEEMSYDDIATIADIPIGTVMSRLSRARAMLKSLLRGEARKEVG